VVVVRDWGTVDGSASVHLQWLIFTWPPFVWWILRIL